MRHAVRPAVRTNSVVAVFRLWLLRKIGMDAARVLTFDVRTTTPPYLGEDRVLSRELKPRLEISRSRMNCMQYIPQRSARQ